MVALIASFIRPVAADEPVIVAVDLRTGGKAPVVELAKGERVSLIIEGAGDATIHLHGYDIEVEATAGQPARLEFMAEHSGWFPAMVHVNDPLLGDREKPLFHLDIRTR